MKWAIKVSGPLPNKMYSSWSGLGGAGDELVEMNDVNHVNVEGATGRRILEIADEGRAVSFQVTTNQRISTKFSGGELPAGSKSGRTNKCRVERVHLHRRVLLTVCDIDICQVAVPVGERRLENHLKTVGSFEVGFLSIQREEHRQMR